MSTYSPCLALLKLTFYLSSFPMQSPVPVVVVRPSTKVRKTVDKREGRQTYRDLVEGSGRPGSSSGAPVKVS